ncbi:MAG: tyrosine-type recombinase/integrase, partial [Aestuariibaculum sp.]
MATINYRLRSKKNASDIYLYLSLGRGKVFERKIGLTINPNDWSNKTSMPKQGNANLKNLTTDLRKLKDFIHDKTNDAFSIGDEVTGDWLQFNIDLHFQRVTEHNLSEYVADAIRNIIDTSETRKNSKGGLGLSKSRINAYTSLINIFEQYETKTQKRYKVKEINIPFANDFLKWLLKEKRYSKSYALKKVADLKTVCYDAETFGIELHPQIKKVGTAKGESDLPVYLTPTELDKIKNTKLISTSLQNARKWFLLGCNIGQRGGDLLKLTVKNFVTRNNGLKVIELKQQKTGANVTIPILEGTNEILKMGLPYKISIQKFNDCIKEICRIAGINEMVQGSKICMIDDKGKVISQDKNGNYIKKGVKRTIKGTYPKYELVSSHTCRRTFATNQHANLPTPLIMKITAHKTERMFLKYVGKSSLDYAQQIADFYELQAL